ALHGDAGLTTLIAVETNADPVAGVPTQGCERRGGGLVRAGSGVAMRDVDRGDVAGLDVGGSIRSLHGQHPWRSAEALCAKISEACGHSRHRHREPPWDWVWSNEDKVSIGNSRERA